MMHASQSTLSARFARGILGLALRFWPNESRRWGEALAAELEEIRSPREVVRWAAGGIVLFARALGSRVLTWLLRPAGSRFDASLPVEAHGQVLPKRSRLFTAAVLAATVLLLSLPQSREAVSTIRASWHNFEALPAELRSLEKLAARAEKEKDARTLAFVAMTVQDPARAASIADRAVALDPSLAWIYSSRFHRPDNFPQPKEWLERLHAADPDNAFPYLLAADSIAYPRYLAITRPRTPTDAEIETALGADPEWLAHMDRAFHASRYDSYSRRYLNLGRETWSREPSLSPSIVLYSLWSHPIPDLLHLKTFARFLIHRAQEASASGHPERAEQLLLGIDSFGSRMTGKIETAGEMSIEGLVGLDLSRQALRELQALYHNTNRSSELAQVSARVSQIEEHQRSSQRHFSTVYGSLARSFAVKANLVQGFAILMVVSGLLAAAVLLILELRRSWLGPRWIIGRRALCFAADYAPATLLVTGLGLLVSFLPFGHVLANYRSTDSSMESVRALLAAMEGLFLAPNVLRSFPDSVAGWSLVTAALSLLAVSLLIHAFRRPRRA